MLIFEPHIHMYSRITDDYERMSLAGVRAVLDHEALAKPLPFRLGEFVRPWALARREKLPNSMLLATIVVERVIDIEEAGTYPPGEVCVVCTGSQGESRAVLAQLVQGQNRYLSISRDDTVVLSSHPIPGNEEMIHRTINKLIQRAGCLGSRETPLVENVGDWWERGMRCGPCVPLHIAAETGKKDLARKAG